MRCSVDEEATTMVGSGLAGMHQGSDMAVEAAGEPRAHKHTHRKEEEGESGSQMSPTC